MNLGITTADLTPAGRAALSRRLVTNVTAQPMRGEVGWTTDTRDMCAYLLDISGCTRWDAVTVEPAYPVSYLPRELNQVITLDDRFLIVATSYEPVGATWPRHSITVNGQTIAHRWHGSGAHGIKQVVDSVWRHLNLVPHSECDALMCHNQPVYAVSPGSGYCPEHVETYAR